MRVEKVGPRKAVKVNQILAREDRERETERETHRKR